MNIRNLAAGFMVCCLLLACNDDTDDDAVAKAKASGLEVVSVPTATEPAKNKSKSATDQPKLGPGLQRLADMAIEHLAGYLGIEKEAISVVDAAFVTWRDSSLGCPSPDYEYLQVLTHGSRIRLSADSRIYEYHSGGSRAPFLCESPADIEPLPYAPGEA